MPVTAKVVENPVHDLIFGASFMKYNQVSIDFRTKMVSMADDLVRAPLQSDNRVQKCITCERSVCISPYSEAIISATCDRRFDNQTVLLEPLTQFQFRRFALARSFSRCENGKTVCQVINYNPQALVLLVTFGRLAVSDSELGVDVIDFDECYCYLFTVLYCSLVLHAGPF